jgi:RHS repeat-associated protein
VEKRDNASVITYSYDDRDNLLSKSYSDGSAETWQYNGFDQATRYVDRDGIVMSFSYDRYGNAVTVSQGGAGVSVMEYDGAGRIVRTLKADGTIYAYSYDSRGNCVARTASKDGGSITEYREYDSRNRLTKIITPLKETALEYFPHKMVIRDSVGLETTYTYNQRKDIVSIEERDTVTGEKRIFAYEYDKRHLPLKVTVTGGAGMMFETRYEYDAAGKKTAEIFGEWRADFAYNSAGRIASRTNTKAGAAETFTETFTYSSSSRGETVTVQKPLGITEAYDYDPWGRLFSVTDPNGNTMRRQLSGQGRILKEQTAFGGYNNFEYDSSGRVCAFGEENSATASVAYNDGGQVIRKTDREGNVTRYEYALTGISKETAPDYTRIYFYDGAGRISKIVTGESGQRYERMTEYAYSDNGRTVTVTQGGLYQSTVRRNAWGDAVSVTNGAGDTRYMSYDALGRVCVSTDAYGNRIVIAYNAIGLVKRVDYPDGSKTEYDYDHAGNLVSVVDDIGIKWQGKYDDAGRLIEERARPGIFKNYSYDGAGNVIGIRNGGETAASYNFADRGRDFSFIDGNGKTYSYVFDGFGRLTGERNRLGKSQSYEYTPEGSLSQKVDFAGRGMTIASEKTGRTRTITAGNSSVTYKFDMSGDIIEAKSESGSIFYTYDAGGRLVRQFDKGADETTTYRYDAAGRRIFMSSGDREVSYRYGKNDELLFVSDNKQRMSVSFEYDTMGREIRRVYGNGVAQATAYDKAGRVIAVSETNPFGALVRFEGYLYDSEGRQSHVIDKNGNVTFYEYDRQSRLSSALYPFGEERRNAAFAEAVEAGLHFGENAGGGENRMLDAEEYSRLTRLLRAVRAEQVPAPSVTQRCIKEMFAYDPNGNRSAKITAFGVIRYAYDAEDRLVSSGDGERGIRYDYDDTGNMIRKKSLFNTLEMRYNGFYRLEYLKMIVKTELHRADMPVTPNSGGADRQYETRYRYDALERRTITQDISGAAFRTLYDGTTFDVIKEQEIFASGAFTGLLSARDSSDDREAGRYRFIDGENEGADRTRTRRLGSGNSSGARGGYAALYANGRAVSVAMPGSNGTRSYFGTDGRGSVKSATGETGGTRSLYEYDAFGASVSGDFSQSAYLGYAGKQLDPATGFYNYGYRDYSPAEGRFTTVDPVRDGLNWFAYVHNDPVNYMDRDGLAEIFGDDIYGKPIADLPGTSIKERTTIEVMRGYSKDPNKEYNDTVKIKIDGQVVSEYTGAQSKKNWEGKTKTQTREQRFENDLTDEDYPNATLPVGDYKAMLGPGKSYTNSLSITSKTAQIPGVSTVGIKESWGFMIHSMTKASDTEARVEARSLGCTILADAKFADFRAQLEGLGLKNWDSVSMKITEETKK